MQTEQNFEVFISFKNSDRDGVPTQDSAVAEELYNALVDRGIRTFYSNSSLKVLGESAYTKAINDALEQAGVLIVVAGKSEYLTSQWVQYEWDTFHNEMLSGRKPDAQIVAYFGDFAQTETPLPLRKRETFKIGSHGVDEVAAFVEHCVNKQKTSVPADDQVELSIGKQLSKQKVRKSGYASDADEELRRLEVQCKNTKACDDAVLGEVMGKLDRRPLWILDLGCAYNYVGNSRFGDMDNVRVLGVDISEKCLDYAVAHSDPDKFVFRYLDLEGDRMVQELQTIMDELGIERFDVMFGALLLLHLKKPVTVLKKLRRFLADDGYMVIRGSDDGSVLAYNDDGLVDKIIEKCHVTVGFSDRHNGRKLYGQLESAGFKDIQVRTFIKDISGKDVDERDEIFFERFAYRINNFRKNHEADPHNPAKHADYIFMKYALQELEEVFTRHDFWYCEQDFLAYGRAK